MQYFVGREAVVQVQLLDARRNPVIPDAGSVTYSVHDHEYNLIPTLAYLPVSLTAAAFTVPVVIPAANMAIAAGRTFENRRIWVDFTVQGQKATTTYTISITKMLRHTVTEEDVRGFIGANEGELPDKDIDLVAAYLEVESDFGEVSLEDALTTGTVVELAANEAILMKAVMTVLPSMRYRMAQMEADGIRQFQRMSLSTMDDMVRTAGERYASAKAKATGIAAPSRTVMLTTIDTDAVTGE